MVEGNLENKTEDYLKEVKSLKYWKDLRKSFLFLGLTYGSTKLGEYGLSIDNKLLTNLGLSALLINGCFTLYYAVRAMYNSAKIIYTGFKITKD